MPRKLYEVHLNAQEREQLEVFVKQGTKSARAITRARILLFADEQKTDEDIATLLGVSRPTVYHLHKKYYERTSQHMLELLQEQPRSGQPIKIDTRVESHISLIACSAPPEGSARWTLQMIADRLVTLNVVESICTESVRKALKNILKPWLKQQWCIGTITGDYIWHMEDVLAQYAKPYDPLCPLICFEERPCQILGDVLVPVPMKPGKPLRYDYEYERHGTCCVLLAFEPHTGFRYLEVRAQRTAADYAQFMQNLVARYYPTVDRICLIQDNLNTHTPGSFYQALVPEEAFQFAQRFELHYTPKKASWLNRAEIAFAVLSQQCLDRRIADRETLAREAHTWADKRNKAHKTVNWKLTKADAREKLQSKYPVLKN